MGRLLNSSAFPQRVTGPRGMQTRNAVPLAPALSAQRVSAAIKGASPLELAERDSLRKLAFRAGLGMLFVMIAGLSEILATKLHVNTYLLYFVAPPAILGAVFTGGLGRTLRHRASLMWLGFFGWMLISVPFSSWMGDSVNVLRSYAEFSLPLMFIVGGLPLNFREVRSTFYTIAAGGLAVIVASRLFGTEDNGRMDLAGVNTSIGNSNDLASLLILVLPFLLFIAMDRRRAAVIRYSIIVPAAYGMVIIFGTASRGALVALAVSFVFVLFRASARQRIAALAIAVTLAGSVPFFLGSNARERLGSLFGGQHEEAKESAESRSYLLKQSLLYTVQHPLFGIGPGQFANYEGGHAVLEGKIGNWHETHNSFTEVSSECGMPALVFFVLGIGSALFSVSRIYQKARRGGYTEIANAGFCYLLSMVGYVVSITFLSNAFRFYLPAMIGLAISLSAAAAREMSAGAPAEAARIPRRTGSVPAGMRMARL